MDETLYVPDGAVSEWEPRPPRLAEIVADALVALLIPTSDVADSVPFAVVTAQVRDYVWTWYRVIPSDATIATVLHACRADTVGGVSGPTAVRAVRLFGPEL